jgi:hypothetical protein
MGFRKLLGMAALGGFLYAHHRRGGQLTMDSFKDTARGLLDDVKMRARDMKEQAEQKLREQRRGEFGTESRVGDDVTGYGSSGFGYTDPNRR